MNFFETMQIPLMLGRSFRPQDNEHAPKVAIVNETMARHFFGNENPIGRQFSWGGPDSTARVEIVGVAADAKYSSLRRESPATVYHPFRQTLESIGSMNFEVRTGADPRAMILAVRRAVQDLDKDLPLFDVKTQNEQVDELLLQERMFAKLSSFFGLLALLLACVGLYGMCRTLWFEGSVRSEFAWRWVRSGAISWAWCCGRPFCWCPLARPSASQSPGQRLAWLPIRSLAYCTD